MLANSVSVPELRSPMPGAVVAIHVNDGDKVNEGAAIIVVEAMKMEHVLRATAAGRVDLHPNDLFDAAEHESPDGSALACRARLQSAIHRVRNVDRGSHGPSMPYLWRDGALLALRLRQRNEHRRFTTTSIHCRSVRP